MFLLNTGFIGKVSAEGQKYTEEKFPKDKVHDVGLRNLNLIWSYLSPEQIDLKFNEGPLTKGWTG